MEKHLLVKKEKRKDGESPRNLMTIRIGKCGI